MGTHPIFESDFDCLTENGQTSRKKTAYTFFVQAEKAEWQEANPDSKIVFGDFMRTCGAKWKTLDDTAKAPFAAKADAKRHAVEMEDYMPEGGGSVKKRKVKKDPNAPKRPQTAFFLFSAEFRAEVRANLPEGVTGIGEVAKELGRRWGELGEVEKSGYQRQAATNKEQYERDMEAYNDENSHVNKRQRQQGSDESDDY